MRKFEAIESGRLCEEARRITRSRAIVLEKKPGDADKLDVAPRPIKIGELLRTTSSERVGQAAAPCLRHVLVRMRQWGISLPGGCEALIHWRSTVEDAARTGIIEPIAVADLDMQNFFNSVEWPAIRASLEHHLQEAVPIVNWEHREPGVTALPDGSEFLFNRGAERGEPLGSIKAALPLGEARCRTADKHAGRKGVCDEWYIDDGQLICEPSVFDTWLRLFDEQLRLIGATRAEGNDVKSVVRLICPDERVSEFDGWATECVRRTCRVQEPNSSAKALGAVVGSDDGIRSAALAVRMKVREKRGAIASLGEAPAEMVLTRRCADVGNISYWFRCYGDKLQGTVTQRFDSDLRAAVEECLGGPLADIAWWQGSVGVKQGGLGMRSAADVALPAFVASRVASRPLVADMFGRIAAAELGSVGDLLGAYDRRTNDAVAAFLRTMPESSAASERWRRLLDTEAARRHIEQHPDEEIASASAKQIGSVAPGLVLDAGAEDDEHPDHGGDPRGPTLQRRLCEIVDSTVVNGLRDHFEQAGRAFGLSRLSVLSHKSMAHTWLWALSPIHGPAIEEEAEFVEAVRVRLGDWAPPDGGVCGSCGARHLGSSGGHASCCAPRESTRGDNAVRDVVFNFSVAADESTEEEPEDRRTSFPLVPGFALLMCCRRRSYQAAWQPWTLELHRPSRMPLARMPRHRLYDRKIGEREDIAAELESQNSVYKLIVWTTFGRPHEGADAAMACIGKRLSRRRGWTSCRALLRQMRAAISLCFARRAARMSLACSPRLTADTDCFIVRRDGGAFLFEAGAV